MYRIKDKGKKDKRIKKIIDHRHILYIIKSRTHKLLVQYINGPTINLKNSHKEPKGILKINFTMLQKYIKIIVM